ncbi:MAG: hypothetical protein ACOCQD_02785 [archaeon]
MNTNDQTIESMIEEVFSDENSFEDLNNIPFSTAMENEESFNKSMFMCETLVTMDDNNKISEEGFVDTIKATLVNLLSLNPYWLVSKTIARLLLDFRGTVKDNHFLTVYLRKADQELVRKICGEIFGENPKKFYLLNVPTATYIDNLNKKSKELGKLIGKFNKVLKDEGVDSFKAGLEKANTELERAKDGYDKTVESKKDNPEEILNAIVEVNRFPDMYMYIIKSVVGYSNKSIFSKNLAKSIKIDDKTTISKDAKDVTKLLVKVVRNYHSFYKQLYKNVVRTSELAIEVLERVNTQYSRRSSLFSELGIGHGKDKDDKR